MDHHPRPFAPTDTPLPPHKRRRTDAGSPSTGPTRSSTETPRATPQDAPDPSASGAVARLHGVGYFLGRARAKRGRHYLPPQAAAPSDRGPRLRTNPPCLAQGTASHCGAHPPRRSLTTPEAPNRPATVPPAAP